MSTNQIAVRLSDALLADLDDLVARGSYDNRAAAIRAGIEAIVQQERRAAVDKAYIDGYTRYPPTAEEDAAALTSTVESIAEEPW